MFYIVEVSYVGPNQREHWDEDEIQVRTKPVLTNMSREEIVSGWAGTTNDWRVDAHGAYETLEAAETAIREKFGPVRENNYNGESFLDEYDPGYPDDPDDPGIVAVFKAGELHPMPPALADQWAYDWREDAREPGADLEKIFQEIEKEAMSDGCTFEPLKSMIIEALENYRDECNNDD